jgi:hypothetical protein
MRLATLCGWSVLATVSATYGALVVDRHPITACGMFGVAVAAIVGGVSEIGLPSTKSVARTFRRKL